MFLLISDRGKEREREGQKQKIIDLVPPACPLIGDLVYNHPGMCSDQKLIHNFLVHESTLNYWATLAEQHTFIITDLTLFMYSILLQFCLSTMFLYQTFNYSSFICLLTCFQISIFNSFKFSQGRALFFSSFWSLFVIVLTHRYYI